MSNVQRRYAAKLAVLLCSILLPSLPSQAHHSAARFDTKAIVEIEGVIKEFAWKNPHTWIKMDVTDKKGNIVEWSFEGNGATYILRTGWKRSTIKPGEKVILFANPLVTGQPGGRFFGVKKSDGTTAGLNEDNTRAPQSGGYTNAEQRL
jgi:hypothetical protein